LAKSPAGAGRRWRCFLKKNGSKFNFERAENKVLGALKPAIRLVSDFQETRPFKRGKLRLKTGYKPGKNESQTSENKG
jgi:hypothetical protein